jgi:hypothetical protein
VENEGGKAYGKATGLYNKHHKYSEQGNSWHLFRSADDFQLPQLFTQPKKIWLYQHLWCGPHNDKVKTFQSADAVRKLLTELDFGLGNDSLIEVQ